MVPAYLGRANIAGTCNLLDAPEIRTKKQRPMGLVFALQPLPKKSKPGEHLVLKTSRRKFALGAGLIFGAALLATMYSAASPLFDALWSEGGLFDKFLTVLILGCISLYPLLALLSWSLDETVEIRKVPEQGGSLWTIEKWRSVLGIKFRNKKSKIASLSELYVDNWKGALNVAAHESKATGKQNRYATRGHWILKAPNLELEKRAKKEDVDFLLAQIQHHFGDSSPNSK